MDTHTEPAPSAHHFRSPETWAKAREDYLAGAPAPEVCARYGIALSTLRERASKEGWRRADQAEPAPFDFAAERDADGFLPGPGPLADDAWMGLLRTLRQDRPREALAWLRLYRGLIQLKREEDSRAFMRRGRPGAGELLPFAAAPEPAVAVTPQAAEPAPPLAAAITFEDLDQLSAADIFARLERPGVLQGLDESLFQAVQARMELLLAGTEATASRLEQLAELDALARTGGSDDLDDLDDLDGVRGSPMAQSERLAA